MLCTVGAVIALVSLPTLVMSGLKLFYAAFVDVRFLQLFAVRIEELYRNQIAPSATLDHWWRLAPEPSPADLFSMQGLYLVAVFGVFAVGAVLLRSGRALCRDVRDAERRRRERQWEDDPDE